MYEVVGMRNVRFDDQKTGQTIDGLKVFAIYEDENVNGVATENFFFGRNKVGYAFDNFRISGHFKVLYNKYGKPDDIEFLD